MAVRYITNDFEHWIAVREPTPAPDRYYLGLDLGQSTDYTACALVRRSAPPDWDDDLAPTDCPDGCRYEVASLRRFPLGTSYPDIVTRVAARLGSLGEVGAMLVVDATGVGMPVVDLGWRAGLCPVAVTITGGFTASHVERNRWHVPKRDLVSVLQMLTQQKRLKVSTGLPDAALLQRELRSFRVRITEAARDLFGAWREGEHDDMVIAVALACWAGENIKKKRIRLV